MKTEILGGGDGLHALLLLSLGGAIFWHVGETFALFVGSLHDQVTVRTPLLLVGIKHILFVCVFVLLFYMGVRRREEVGEGWLFIVLLLGWGGVSFLLSKDVNLWSLFCGLKWLAPIVGIFMFVPVVNEAGGWRLVNMLLMMMIANMMLQLFQVFLMQPWYGVWLETRWAARPPGFFFIPSTAAFFVCSSVLLMLSLKDIKSERTNMWPFILLGFVSVFLTLSGTGFTVMLVVLGVLLSGKVWRKLAPAIIIGSYFITKNVMPYFRGDGYFDASLGVRMEILSGVSGVSGVSDIHFGSGTAAAWLLKTNFGIDIHPVMTDSFLAQLMVNMGDWALVGFVLALGFGALTAWLNDRPSGFLWMIFLGMFSVTFPITESFPTFLAVAYGIAYEIRRGSYRADRLREILIRVKHRHA